MSNITLKYKDQKLFINPGWAHEIMFLLVREFESDRNVMQKYNLQEIIDDYKMYYAVAGDVFEDPTSFDEILKDNQPLHDLFLTTLRQIKEKLITDNSYLTIQDLQGKVDIGTKFLNNEIDTIELIHKIEEVELLLKQQ